MLRVFFRNWNSFCNMPEIRVRIKCSKGTYSGLCPYFAGPWARSLPHIVGEDIDRDFQVGGCIFAGKF
jgi:hypothetical protein